jgi:hypothetical protein
MKKEDIKQMTIKSENLKEFDELCNSMRKDFEVIAEQTTILHDSMNERFIYVAVIFYAQNQ